jgi:predicted metal-dependent peptidase
MLYYKNNKEMEPHMTQDIAEKAKEKLIKARITMLLKYPFWGPLSARLVLEEAPWCQTIATDGRKFYYNSEFVLKLDDQECVFGFAHEVGHIIYEHMTRRGNRDPGLWNMAGDYIINNMLVRENVGRTITTVPILVDRQYENHTADEVYDKLFDNNAEVQQTLDDHLDLDGEGDEQQGQGGNSSAGKPKFKKLSSEEKKALRNEWKEAVIDAVNKAGASNVPGEVKRLVKQITEPVLDLRELFQIQFSSSLKSDYTWMRPNRKGWHTGAVLPGNLPGEQLDVVIALDASGSIWDSTLSDFLGIVQGSLDQFDAYNVKIITFDTSVYNEDNFTQDDGRDMSEYAIQGGGGTDFDCIWEWLKYNDVTPHQLVVLTDGYPWGSWGDENYCDTLFVIHGNEEIKAPFGITANYMPKK